MKSGTIGDEILEEAMRERLSFEADDPLGVPCGIIMSEVEPGHGVAKAWEERWTKYGLDPLVAAWNATRSVANLVVLLRELVPEERVREIVDAALATEALTSPLASLAGAARHVASLEETSRMRALDAIRAAAPAPPSYGALLEDLEAIRAVVQADLAAHREADKQREREAREEERARRPRYSFAELFEQLAGVPFSFPIPEDALACSYREEDRDVPRMVYSPGLYTPAARDQAVTFEERNRAPSSKPDAVRKIFDLTHLQAGIFSTSLEENQKGFTFKLHAIEERARIVLEYDCPNEIWQRLGRERVAKDLPTVTAIKRSAEALGPSFEICLVGGFGYARVVRSGHAREIVFVPPPTVHGEAPRWMFDHAILPLHEPYQRSIDWMEVAALVSDQR